VRSRTSRTARRFQVPLRPLALRSASESEFQIAAGIAVISFSETVPYPLAYGIPSSRQLTLQN
jgi:hypothetical protein